MAQLGLGGTSLINGNIYLEADRSTLSASGWPLEITRDPEYLEKCEHKRLTVGQGQHITRQGLAITLIVDDYSKTIQEQETRFVQKDTQSRTSLN